MQLNFMQYSNHNEDKTQKAWKDSRAYEPQRKTRWCWGSTEVRLRIRWLARQRNSTCMSSRECAWLRHAWLFFATKDTSILLVRCYEVRDQIENRILLTVLNGKAHLPFHMLMNAYMKNVFFQTYVFRLINLPSKKGRIRKVCRCYGSIERLPHLWEI